MRNLFTRFLTQSSLQLLSNKSRGSMYKKLTSVYELTCEQVQIIFGTHFLVVYVTIQSFPIRQKLIKMAVLLPINHSP